MVPIKRDANAPIKVAQLAAVESAPATRLAAPVKETQPAGMKLYTVRAGDTLYDDRAALSHHGGHDHCGLNKLTAKAVLHPGLRLRLP